MSRSILRTLAAVALVAATATISEAQVSCSIQPGSASPQTCNFTGAVTVPTLARLDVSGDSLAGSALALTSPDWATYLSAPAATRTLSQVGLVVRANTSYAVQINSAASWTVPAGGARALADLTYTAVAGACPAANTINTAITASPAALFNGASATASSTRNLCFALAWSGALDGGDLAPGAYSLPITLTLSAP
ncbi:MAG TPA: hypothetical protein PK788_02335 [Gemmatimonadaceae bacterium]|nr:hypothetical protein [Gemmatimonadaceae bacterium]HRQ78081.1 hypothetical protein [Gemmatimonadaceae bacterium]